MAVTQFKYGVGQEVQERASSGPGAVPQKLIVAERGYFEGQPAYVLNEADSGLERGWYSEDMIEPYEPTPITRSGGQN